MTIGVAGTGAMFAARSARGAGKTAGRSGARAAAGSDGSDVLVGTDPERGVPKTCLTVLTMSRTIAATAIDQTTQRSDETNASCGTLAWNLRDCHPLPGRNVGAPVR
jgi:hypothetical protein